MLALNYSKLSNLARKIKNKLSGSGGSATVFSPTKPRCTPIKATAMLNYSLTTTQQEKCNLSKANPLTVRVALRLESLRMLDYFTCGAEGT